MKKAVLVFLAVVMLISFVGCGGIDGSKANATINEFFSFVEAGDYASAQALLHPDRSPDLEAIFTSFAEQYDLDYSSGINIKSTVSTLSSAYDTEVKGSTYGKRYILEVSGKEFESEIQIVQNDNGYGVYNFFMAEKE